ncbi:hypothetical protein AWZ03_007219 [Drosophila navojoa]|uniref:Uncharacterized protein n=1 Tax=Drosophila navojoa TaxID=7232 RepID=A0A484BEA9_DRONA|nr:hypothetical protein AWZ03_007219 [Drosophila navojoa]
MRARGGNRAPNTRPTATATATTTTTTAKQHSLSGERRRFCHPPSQGKGERRSCRAEMPKHGKPNGFSDVAQPSRCCRLPIASHRFASSRLASRRALFVCESPNGRSAHDSKVQIRP